MIVNDLVSFSTLCETNVRQADVAFLQCPFVSTFFVRGVVRAVVTHGVHFVSWMLDAAVLV